MYTSMTRLGATTMLLACMAWAQMGVMRKFLAAGSMIGPPAEREYAVEPVGVQRMTPSPEKFAASTPSQ